MAALIPLYQSHALTAQPPQVLAAKSSYLQTSPEDRLWLMGIGSIKDVWGAMPLFRESTHSQWLTGANGKTAWPRLSVQDGSVVWFTPQGPRCGWMFSETSLLRSILPGPILFLSLHCRVLFRASPQLLTCTRLPTSDSETTENNPRDSPNQVVVFRPRLFLTHNFFCAIISNNTCLILGV